MDLNLSLQEKGFPEVNYMEFYREIFPEGSFERKGVYDDGKSNGIIVEVTNEKINGKQKVLRHTLTDELEKLDEVTARDNFCIMSPISYIGKSRKSENARFMYALAVDLDGVTTQKQFDFLMKQIEKGDLMRGFVWGLPCPTYIVASGTGVHLYYVFEAPIPLFRNIVEELEKLKRRLTWQAWTQGASELHDNVQYESLFQGFRVVGTVTKSGDRTRAYKTGGKVTVEYLNEFVPDDYRAKEFTYKSELTLQQAREKYPDWYERRIEKKQPKGSWVCKIDLYNWWIRKIYEGATQGHRYWAVMTLATYAKKCGVSYEQLVTDSIGMIDYLNSIGDGTDEFTIDDVMHAVEAYDDSYITYPIDTIVARTDIPIVKNKRNYRKQTIHLYLARRKKEDLKVIGESVQEGRPSKEQIVRDWKALHPNGRKADCIRETGLAKMTVYKWWEV